MLVTVNKSISNSGQSVLSLELSVGMCLWHVSHGGWWVMPEDVPVPDSWKLVHVSWCYVKRKVDGRLAALVDALRNLGHGIS